MASKIFMGSMPELMKIILKNLENESSSLYSCALVSRHWCKMSIPILWQDPYSFDHQRPLFISRYFTSLDEVEKLILNEYEIIPEFSETLFNYARFLKVLNLFYLEMMVQEWIEFQLVESKSPGDPLIYHISNLLFKLFIENGASLHTLSLNFSDHTKIKPEIFYLLGQNVQFFSQLQELSLGIITNSCSYSTIDTITLLKILAKNSTKLSVLEFDEYHTYYDPPIYRALVDIINSQKQLMKFCLVGDDFPDEFHGIISALESQKQSLRELSINRCFCNEEFEMLRNCENLAILRIERCEYERLLTLSDYRLSTLEIVDRPLDASKIILILEKSGTLLQRLKLESRKEMIFNQSLLLKTLKSFCPNITHLEILNIELSSQLLDLVGKLLKLQFLTLRHLCFNDDITPEEQVLTFAKILPLTLQYLNIMNSCLDFYIDILLDNCYAPLKKLLIFGRDDEKPTKAIIEFCIRKRTLNYIGVIECFDKFKKELEGYVTVAPYSRIVVYC